MKKILLILVVVAAVLAAWLWFRRSAPAEAGEEAKPAAQVQLVPLRTGTIAQTLSAVGTVGAAPAGARALTLAYDSVVAKVAVSVGARVAAGDLIMEVAPTPDAEMQFDSARADSGLADKALASARERYDLKLGTNQDLLTAQMSAEDAAIKLKSFRRRGLGGDGRIVAPAAGIVTKLDWQPGANVTAGSILATIAATAGLEASLGIEAADAASVRPGQAVVLSSVNRPEAAPVTAAVRSVGANLDPASGAIEVRVPLPDSAGLDPGEHVKAEIELRRESGLIAPRGAVLPDGEEQVLFTVVNHKAVKHSVQIRFASGDSLEISGNDLHPGDSVVAMGNYELEDGMAVQPAPKDTQPAGKKGDEAKP